MQTEELKFTSATREPLADFVELRGGKTPASGSTKDSRERAALFGARHLLKAGARNDESTWAAPERLLVLRAA